MYKIFYLLSIFVALGRDYIFVSDSLATFIFTIMLVDAIVEIILKPFSLRSLNFNLRLNYFYSPNGLIELGCIITLATILIMVFGVLVGFENTVLFGFLLLAKSGYKVVSNKALYSKNFNSFYLFEFVRNVSIALSFYLESLSFYLVCLILITLVCFLKYSLIKIKTRCQTKLIYKVYRSDWLMVLQAFLSASYVVFDKTLESIKSDSTFLEYLLVTKFIMFSLNLFSGFSLQIFQIQNRNHRKSITSFLLIKRNLPFISIIVLGFIFFFTCLIGYLPVGERLTFEPVFLALAVGWLLSMLIREACIKANQMRGDFKIVSALVLVILPIHIITVTALSLSVNSLLLLNTITSLLIIKGLLISEYYKKARS
ncbi:hypothetical protein [Psychrosphaera haliotis]|uniref:Uncharacterized protein n=1 Tax=Psychrosphaera haliotis TaxID=555083 RepID=A0A6N8F3V3_9GAMM|nr:hypothetical protein [Psychrosphaera haliotis]MUH71346.1 hypothetical protein [Psychrosphaera haliotis]